MQAEKKTSCAKRHNNNCYGAFVLTLCALGNALMNAFNTQHHHNHNSITLNSDKNSFNNNRSVLMSIEGGKLRNLSAATSLFLNLSPSLSIHTTNVISFFFLSLNDKSEKGNRKTDKCMMAGSTIFRCCENNGRSDMQNDA